MQDHAKDLNRDLLQERFEDYQVGDQVFFYIPFDASGFATFLLIEADF